MFKVNHNTQAFNYTKYAAPTIRAYHQLPSVTRSHSSSEDESITMEECVDTPSASQTSVRQPFAVDASINSDIADQENPLFYELYDSSVENEDNYEYWDWFDPSPSSSNELIVNPNGDEPLHYLHNFWTLWYLENDQAKPWAEKLNEMATIGNVEDFWNIYNNIKRPSELKTGCDYSFFKRGIRPMWEDLANIKGGRWVVTLNKTADVDLDEIWLNILITLISETFDNADEVCGVVVNIRYKVNKVSIWTANGENKDAVLEIGKKLRDTLCLAPNNMQYQIHQEIMNNHSSMLRPTYVL